MRAPLLAAAASPAAPAATAADEDHQSAFPAVAVMVHQAAGPLDAQRPLGALAAAPPDGSSCPSAPAMPVRASVSAASRALDVAAVREAPGRYADLQLEGESSAARRVRLMAAQAAVAAVVLESSKPLPQRAERARVPQPAMPAAAVQRSLVLPESVEAQARAAARGQLRPPAPRQLVPALTLPLQRPVPEQARGQPPVQPVAPALAQPLAQRPAVWPT